MGSRSARKFGAVVLGVVSLAACGGAVTPGGSGSTGGSGSSSGSAGGSSSTSGGGGRGGTGGSSSGTFIEDGGIGFIEDGGVGDDSPIFEEDASRPVDSGVACPGESWNGSCHELIDDLETNTGFLPPMSGRDGARYTYNDGTPGSTQTPAPWPASAFSASPTAPPFPDPVTGANSAFSAETSGSGFTTWGAGMGFQFVLASSQGTQRPYNASAYKGVVFWARAQPGSQATAVRVTLSDSNTNSSVGACGTPAECDPFGQTISLGVGWQSYTLPFASLQQESWGKPYPALVPSALYNMNFQVQADQTFDFVVDDIYFELSSP